MSRLVSILVLIVTLTGVTTHAEQNNTVKCYNYELDRRIDIDGISEIQEGLLATLKDRNGNILEPMIELQVVDQKYQIKRGQVTTLLPSRYSSIVSIEYSSNEAIVKLLLSGGIRVTQARFACFNDTDR